MLRSLFETARRQGKKAQDFFYQLFTKETAEAQASLYRQPTTKKQRCTPGDVERWHKPWLITGG